MRRGEAATREREAEFRAKFRAAGRTFLGARAVKAQRITDTPASRELRRKLSPQVACRDKWRRIERLMENKRFRAEHDEAREDWKRGVRDVVFPHGTYAMCKLHRVRVFEPGRTHARWVDT